MVDVKVVTNLHWSFLFLILHLDTVTSDSVIIIFILIIMNNIMVIVVSIRGGNIEQQHYRQ